jgi:hypothetical protein
MLARRTYQIIRARATHFNPLIGALLICSEAKDEVKRLEAGAAFKSLADTWADTPDAARPVHADPARRPCRIRARADPRQEWRRAEAREQARGVRFGRKPKLTAHQRQEAIARREAGEMLVDIARSYNVSHPIIMRLVQ